MTEKEELIIEIRVGEYCQKLPYTEDGIKLAKGFLDLIQKLIEEYQQGADEDLAIAKDFEQVERELDRNL